MNRQARRRLWTLTIGLTLGMTSFGILAPVIPRRHRLSSFDELGAKAADQDTAAGEGAHEQDWVEQRAEVVADDSSGDEFHASIMSVARDGNYWGFPDGHPEYPEADSGKPARGAVLGAAGGPTRRSLAVEGGRTHPFDGVDQQQIGRCARPVAGVSVVP